MAFAPSIKLMHEFSGFYFQAFFSFFFHFEISVNLGLNRIESRSLSHCFPYTTSMDYVIQAESIAANSISLMVSNICLYVAQDVTYKISK